MDEEAARFQERVKELAAEAETIARSQQAQREDLNRAQHSDPFARLRGATREAEREEHRRRRWVEQIETLVVQRLQQAQDAVPSSLWFAGILSGWGLHTHQLGWQGSGPGRALWVAVDPKIGLAKFAWAVGGRPVTTINMEAEELTSRLVERVVFGLLDQAIWGAGDMPSLTALLEVR